LKVQIPAVDVQRAGLASISVGQVSIGALHVGELVLDNASLSMSAGPAVLRNLSVTVTLRITLGWHIHVGLPWPFDDIDFGDTYDLGSPAFSMPVGDVTIPQLNSIQVRVPSLRATNTSLGSVAPLTNLQLGAVTAEQVRARTVVLPAAGFSVAGLSLTSVQGTSITVPAGSVGEVTIGRVHGAPVTIPSLTLGDLSLPTMSIPDITSQAPFDIPTTFQARTFTMPAGVLRLSLTIRPSAISHVDQLRLTNTRASASVQRIVVRDVVLPYEIHNLTLSQIGIDTISVPTFTVS
jgi:hypothetical protein